MRAVPVLAVLALTATASAEPCELSLEVHGALVDATLRERVLPSPDATALDYELPAGARLVGFALRGTQGAGTAIAVPASPQVEEVSDASVLGPDPAFVTALPASDAGRPRFRAIVEPIAAGRDVVAVARWTALADIRGGELHLVVPASTSGTCQATVRAHAGAGASVARIRAGTVVTRGASASFPLADRDAELAIELAFTRSEPIVWVQREPLGDGTTAEAVTVLAPPAATLARTHRALLVIDTSRSMELLGHARVSAAIHAVVDALPPGSQLAAIAFDRAPAALFDGWKPAGPEALAALDELLARRPAGNGSDLAGALVLAHNALASVHEPAIVVAITDSALGDADPGALARALGDARGVD
ncbi:MAG: VWA domain-containing protein, partial [Acidobacteriota bacterium]